MISDAPDILKRICRRTREDVSARRCEVPLREVRAAAEEAPAAADFAAALREGACVSVIAEIKKASPSAGLIRPDLNPREIARIYEAHRASAISVLTDTPFFQGSLETLRSVRKTVSLPLLRKDFILDEYQVYETRAAGASALLLIVAALDDEALGGLHDLTTELGMDALVEVHERTELERALAIDPAVLGVNNRNLHTFDVRLETTERLAEGVPAATVLVSESGIKTREDVRRVAARGADAVLVGESLMRSQQIGQSLQQLASVPRQRR